jgi:rSAM/selenodomain-associated transferase 2
MAANYKTNSAHQQLRKQMEISIIVPVLNEEALINKFLSHLRERAPDAEVIIADGTSNDGTVDAAKDHCDCVVQTRPNRGRQMNAGAKIARGGVFWFLHVDAEVPPGAITEIEQALQDRHVAGGFFRIRIPRRNPVYRLTDSFGHYAGLLLRMRCGDHGFFCRREIFAQIDGFPELDLMEDVEFFRKLRRAGRVVVIPKRIVVSARRYEQIGPLRLTLAYGLIATLYFFGAPLRLLDRIYRRHCCREPACPPARSASY